MFLFIVKFFQRINSQLSSPVQKLTRKMQFLIRYFQHVCKTLINFFKRCKNCFGFLTSVQNFSKNFVFDASFFVLFFKTNAKM